MTEQLLLARSQVSCSVWICGSNRVNIKGMRHYPGWGQLLEAEEVKSLPSGVELEWS